MLSTTSGSGSGSDCDCDSHSGHEDATAASVMEAMRASRDELAAARAQTNSIPELSRLEADNALCSRYEKILRCSFAPRPECVRAEHEHEEEEYGGQQGGEGAALEDKLLALRRLVISSGLPHTDFYCCSGRTTTGSSNNINNNNSSSSAGRRREVPDEAAPSLRACVWKVLLGALVVDVSTYLALMRLGPCQADKKIRDDTFRTYKNNEVFWAAVSESQLTRVLTATARVLTTHTHTHTHGPRSSDNGDSGSGSSTSLNTDCDSDRGNVGYVQGMNVLLAPLLFVMSSELDAFACFSALLAKHLPRYILANLEGVHSGCALAEACLQALDPALHAHLQLAFASQLHMEIFMFQFVLTMFANASQLDQVLVVWDALFAFGVHFNCVLVATHIMLQRDALLAETSAFRLQRAILQTPLDGVLLVKVATRLLCFVPPGLRQDMLLHPVEAGGGGTSTSTSTAKFSSSAGFRSGLLQKTRSKSSSNLRNGSSSGSSGGNGDTRHVEARINYLSASKMSSLSRSTPRPKSAGNSRPNSGANRSRSNSGTTTAFSSSISASRLLNPSLRNSAAAAPLPSASASTSTASTGRRADTNVTTTAGSNTGNNNSSSSSNSSSNSKPRRTSLVRPSSAPSSRSKTKQQPQTQIQAQTQTQPEPKGGGGRKEGRSEGWVRSLRVVPAAAAATTVGGSTNQPQTTRNITSPRSNSNSNLDNSHMRSNNNSSSNISKTTMSSNSNNKAPGRRYTSGITNGRREQQPAKKEVSVASASTATATSSSPKHPQVIWK